MGNVQKPSNSEGYTPSSEPFRIYQIIPWSIDCGTDIVMIGRNFTCTFPNLLVSLAYAAHWSKNISVVTSCMVRMMKITGSSLDDLIY
jgi:hypothetical protein